MRQPRQLLAWRTLLRARGQPDEDGFAQMGRIAMTAASADLDA